MKQKNNELRPFWQQYLIVLGVNIGLVLVLGLFAGFHQLSNLFFLSTILLLIVAVVPIFGEFGSSGKVIREMQKKGVSVTDEEANRLKEQLDKNRRGTRTTFVFGLAAITAFILAIQPRGRPSRLRS